MPSIKELQGWMTTKQAAERLGRSRQGTINLAEDGRLRAVKVGGEVWAYDPESVEDLAGREQPRTDEMLIEKAGTMLRLCQRELGRGMPGIEGPYVAIVAGALAIFGDYGGRDAVVFVSERWDKIEQAASMHPATPERPQREE